MSCPICINEPAMAFGVFIFWTVWVYIIGTMAGREDERN